MKTDPDHEQKRTKFNLAMEGVLPMKSHAISENLACANCGQPTAAGSTLCPDCLPINDFVYRFRSWHIPARMMPGIQRYIHERIKPGQFLTAVICNNLSDAMGQADDENLNSLPAYASFFHNEAPAPCWGSKKKMKEWLEGGK